MNLRTTSETISFLRELEGKAADFYKDLAERFPEHKDLFLSFVKDSKKYVTQVERAYYSVITDAIEGCFAFDLDTDQFVLDTELPDGVDLKEAIKKAVALEEKMLEFYDVAAQQSGSLMADVPRNLKLVAKKRRARLEKIKELG